MHTCTALAYASAYKNITKRRMFGGAQAQTTHTHTSTSGTHTTHQERKKKNQGAHAHRDAHSQAHDNHEQRAQRDIASCVAGFKAFTSFHVRFFLRAIYFLA